MMWQLRKKYMGKSNAILFSYKGREPSSNLPMLAFAALNWGHNCQKISKLLLLNVPTGPPKEQYDEL
jgi:hypothetical protein